MSEPSVTLHLSRERTQKMVDAVTKHIPDTIALSEQGHLPPEHALNWIKDYCEFLTGPQTTGDA